MKYPFYFLYILHHKYVTQTLTLQKHNASKCTYVTINYNIVIYVVVPNPAPVSYTHLDVYKRQDSRLVKTLYKVGFVSLCVVRSRRRSKSRRETVR